MNRAKLPSGGGSFPATLTLSNITGHLAHGLTRYAGNPVLAKGPSSWDAWGVRELGPVIGENQNCVTESDGIWAYYGGFPDGTATGPWQIGLAKSTDGGMTWTKYASNPVIAPAGTGWYQAAVTQPSTVKQANGTRVMFASGRGPSMSSADRMGVLTSADGLTWTDAGQKLTLSQFTDGGSSPIEMGVPTMIRRKAGDWLVLFEALTSPSGSGKWRIYGATATDPTLTWTPLNGGAPLLAQTGAGWESIGVANPHVFQTSDGYYALLYNGLNTAWQIGFAYSGDLLTWTRYASNPILSAGSASWENLEVETSFMFRDPGGSSFRILYQGYATSDGSMEVGLASAT